MKTLKLLIKSGFFDKTNVNGEQSTSEDSGSSHSPKSHWSDRLLVGLRIGLGLGVLFGLVGLRIRVRVRDTVWTSDDMV